MSRLVVLTPGVAVITAADVKQHTRVDTDADDSYITSVLIPAAHAMFVDETGLFLSRTVLHQFDPIMSRASVRIDLKRGPDPVISGATVPVQIDESIDYVPFDYRYIDSTKSLASIEARDPDAVRVIIGEEPDPQTRIAYTAGFTAAPENARLWLLAQVAHMYDNRAAFSTDALQPLQSVQSLIAEWRRQSI